MDENSFLSICIAARNEESTLRRTIEAIVSSHAWQKASRREILICINGSSDGTSQVALELTTEHPEIGYFVVDEGSKGAAWNFLVKKSSSEAEILVFVDADVVPKADAFCLLTEKLKTDSRLDLVGALALPASSSDVDYPFFHGLIAEFLGHGVVQRRCVREAHVAGCCYAIRRLAAVSIILPEEPVAGDDVALNAYFSRCRAVLAEAVVFYVPPNLWDRIRVSARNRRQQDLFQVQYPELFERLKFSLLGPSKAKLWLDFFRLNPKLQLVAAIYCAATLLGVFWGLVSPARGRTTWSIPLSTKRKIA